MSALASNGDGIDAIEDDEADDELDEDGDDALEDEVEETTSGEDAGDAERRRRSADGDGYADEGAPDTED